MGRPLSGYEPAADERIDRLLRDRVQLWQRKGGYRTSVDATLLAWFAASLGSPRRIVDLGIGSGLVAILLARRFAEACVQGVEKQPQMARRATENAALNGVEDRLTVWLHDLADGAPPSCKGADLVVSNPPFHQTAGRLLPEDPERLTAHYESTASIAQFATAARALLAEGGTTAWIYPKALQSQLVDGLRGAGLGTIGVRDVLHRPGHDRVTRVLVDARAGTEGVVSLPSIALHPADSDDSRYSPAIEAFLAQV